MRRNQRRAGLDRQLGRAGGHPGGFAEEVDLHARPGQVAVGHQAHEPVVAQPLGEHLERRPLAAGQRQHLEPEAFPVVDEPAVQRFRLQSLGDGGERAVRAGRATPRPYPSCRCAAAPGSPPRPASSAASSARCRADAHVVEPARRASAGPSSATGMPPASIGRRRQAKHESARPARWAGVTPSTRARFLRSCSGPPPRAA